MNTLFSLSRNTFREAIRDRIFLVILFFAFVLVLVAPLAGALSPGQEQRLIIDFGLAMIHIFGLFLTVFLGSRLIFNEIEKKTIFLLIAKPLPRAIILLGKFFGLAAVLLCTTGAMSIIFFLLTPFSFGLLGTIALLYLSFLLLLSIVLFFSSFMSPLIASISGILMFFVGNLTYSLKIFGQKFGGVVLNRFGNAVYHLLPNFSNLNLKNSVLYEIPFTAGEILSVVSVTILFIAIFLSLAVTIFSRREFD